MVDHPEHDKLAKIADKSQVCGEFHEWLMAQGYVLARYDRGYRPNELFPVRRRLQDMLAEFFGIDRAKLEQEKRAMLAEIHTIREKGNSSCG
jgi:hypothetical protein